MSQTVRTRFAPSPTGYIHVGNLRTALFAWLLARQNDGQFILRLEDTDQAREVEGAAGHIIESLGALGLDFDEGPIRQSEHLDLYKDYAQQLIDKGMAYADPYTPAEVQAFREQAQKAKLPFLYRNNRPINPPVWDGSQPLRFKTEPRDWEWDDAVMGHLKVGPETQDDFILIKSDGFPTYNFAHIVDDAEMKITHVIRGQEFIASTPNYLNLYQALGLKRPILATMPHILGADGNKKLSKRDGAKDVLDYLRDGYLSEALVSFIATLGWNDGSEQEIFTEEELIKKFSLERVSKSGAHFDERRLLWVNGSFIRELPLDELAKKVDAFWPPEATTASAEYKLAVLGLTQERLKYFDELPALTNFFFTNLPVNMTLIDNNKQLKKLDHQEINKLLEQTRASLQDSNFSVDDLTERLNQLLETTGQKPGTLFSLIRVTTTWAPASPGLADTLHVLGKEKSLERLANSLASLNSKS
ncbi:MAG: glutamate--tRNA ligase [Candidatus Saccharibacteria bacterium]